MTDSKKSIWSRVIAFVKWHPVLFNFIAIIITFVVLVWLLGVVFLGIWTNHGDTVIVPQVKGLPVGIASNALINDGFEVELDSIYDLNSQPGIVVEQSPHEGAKVKDGRTIYLRYVCYTPKMVKVPHYDSRSERSVKTELQSLGITNITVKYVPASNPNVLGLRYNGLLLRPDDEVPVGASITMEVGQPAESTVYYDSYNDYGVYDDEQMVFPEDEDEQFLRQIDSNF